MVSVIIVACCLFLSMFVLVKCLLNVFAIYVDEVTVLSVKVIVLYCSQKPTTYCDWRFQQPQYYVGLHKHR